MRTIQYLFLTLALAMLAASCSAPVQACPLCGPPSLTLCEQFAQADAVVLVKWVGGEEATKTSAGTTKYEVVKVERDTLKATEKGKTIVYPRHRPGKTGEICLLFGTRGPTVEWTPLDITQAGFDYLSQAPEPSLPTAARLKYFVKFFQHADPLVAADAYVEFANAPYKDILAIIPELPREKLREWLTSKETPSTRIGLYGMLLGLCGKPEDASIMESRIFVNDGEFRLGTDGIMAGYLILTREKGLEKLVEIKFKAKKAAFSDVYSAMQAIGFMWTYGEGRIAHEQLKAAMRVLLDRADMADIVIANLARWKDWEIRDKLMEIYGQGDHNVPSTKRAIIRYMFAATRDVPKAPKLPTGQSAGQTSETVSEPEHVKAAKRHLETLKKLDPMLYADVEKYP